ncbi:cytochrome oxidase small assembly protein [Variovorax sp. RHLX14]
MATTPEQKKRNRRMGLTLASIAVLFFIGFMVRMVVIGR